MDISIKNLLLAGIGAVSVTFEKGMEMIEDLVKKGELTVSQGKELTDELKRKATAQMTQKPEEQPLTVNKLKEVLSTLQLVTKDEFEALNERIKRLESK